MVVQLGGLDAYTDDVWERLPSDTFAFQRHREDPVEDSTFEDIGNIFVRNNIHDRLLLYLNHRHFHLQPGESVVEYGDVTTPWTLKEAPDAVKAGISGKTWAFFEEGLRPTEFSYSASGGQTYLNTVSSEFVDELGTYLRNHELQGRFGLTALYKHEDPEAMKGVYETTMGRVSIQVPKGDDPPDGTVEVAWKFDENGRRAVWGCLKCCNAHN
jgi:hypothetical protein